MMLENPTTNFDEPIDNTHPMPGKRAHIWSAVEAGMLLVAAIFFALHFVHLKADFPNHSLWMDWSKYTDEGWYGDAAIRHYQLGHWNVPGDFNAGAALPVWPALELVLFRFTGVSLAAARALTVTVFGLILVCCYLLIRRWIGSQSLAPAIAVMLLAVNPFCYVFSRLAILEPLLILLTLAALLVVSSSSEAWNRQLIARLATLGLLLALMVLTKTTGLFLFPAIFWLLWSANGYRVKPVVRAAALSGGVGIAAWGGYYLLFVRPHYLIDYRYLFSANAYTGITRATFWTVLHDTLFYTTWIGQTLFWVAIAAVIGALICLCFPRPRGSGLGSPLVVALLLWIFGYGTFLAYHANLQPRYYLVLAIPLLMVVAVAFDAVLAAAVCGGWWLRLLAVSGGVALLFAVVRGGSETIGFVRNPEYGWISAAARIREAVDREAAASGHSRLVLSISGSDLALMEGLPAICDDFGTMTLPDRVTAFKPGWFATWNYVEDDKMDALSPMYRLVRVGAYPAFDDPERNLLILYRLDRVTSPGPKGRPGRRRSLAGPSRLRTQVGEQPSPEQLKH